ncbi:MAG: o-succinylbenzoate synthase [Thermoflexales bacterium]|nr:o-succinylbenzoate synthase [Thermoflexales bacterium]
MKIDQIDLYQIHMPLVAPFETSFGSKDHRNLILARVCADGLVGWGEYASDGPGYSYETVESGWHILKDYLIPLALSAPFSGPRECPERFHRVRGHNFAKSCLEGALWDLFAQRSGLSLRAYLDAGRGITRDRVTVGVSIGIQPSPQKLAEKIETFLQYGYLRIKIKIKPGRDIEDARVARSVLPGRMLMVDANSAYSLADAGVFQAMEDLDLLMIEQPLGYDDIYEHHKLQRQLRTPICLDESIHTPDHARMAIELDACKIINIKQGRSGGLTRAIEIHDLCQAAGMPVWCGGMLETGIGRALNLALASLPNFTLPSDLSASNRYYNPDIIDPPFDINPDGTLSVPTGPGLGVQIVPSRLKAATLRAATFRP